MGYTHYWYRPETIELPTWKLVLADITKLVEAFPDTVVWAGNIETMRPELSEDMVELNGPDGKGYEPFRLTRVRLAKQGERVKDDGLWFDFCKTDRRPYDLLVAASLLVLKRHLGKGVRVMTDGKDSDWSTTGTGNTPGPKTFCQKVLGYGFDYIVDGHSELTTNK